MIDRFEEFRLKNKLFNPNDRLLLAVSGGMDSMVMAELCFKHALNFAFIHCNFKLRDQESDEDEQFVKEVAGKYKVHAYCRSFDTLKHAQDAGISVQMAARELRYAYFEEIAYQHNYDRIATAHHLDDQTETFFINLLRGCGIAGLHGINLKIGRIIRPMMFATRSEIEAFVKQNEISYREDQSNAEIKYMRNKIRHEVIPPLVEINPDLQKEMARNIRRLSGVEYIYRQAIINIIEEIVSEREGMISIDIDSLMENKAAATILYEVIHPFGYKEDDIENILHGIGKQSGKRFYSQTHQLLIDRNEILIVPVSDEQDQLMEYRINRDDSFFSGPLNFRICTVDKKGFSIPTEKDSAALDLDKLHFPLTLRKWKQGDYFFPLGMKNRKKLSDLLIDEKYPLFKKENTWVLCSENEIVWVVGERIDERFKITDHTRRVFSLSIDN